MKKLLFVIPHLSTGGLPQYIVKKVELLIDTFDIYAVEYSDVTGGRLVVQKNRIKSLLKNELITLGEDKGELIRIIEGLQPSVIHMEEIPEMFCDRHIAKQIYKKDRSYFIYETCHDSSFDVANKQFIPDKMVLVSNYQKRLFSPLGIPIEVIDYPIEFSNNKLREQYRNELGLDPNKKHILNVGLFTPRKNQKEFFEYARRLPQYQFHQVGNMADNFRFYWEPLLKDVPPNLKVWNERSDVHKFYEAMDLFLFTSRGTVHDKETMPLVLKEAISANLPIALYNLPVYENFFDQFNDIQYLDFDNLDNNINIIQNMLSGNTLKKLDIKNTDTDLSKIFNCEWKWNEQKMYYSVNQKIDYPVIVALREYKSNSVLWSTLYKEGIPATVNFWMIPTPKHLKDYSKWGVISGIKFCVYNAETNEQIYEYPFFKKFVNIPTISLSNSIPYHYNYLEFFVYKKYERFFNNKKFDNVVDVGANVGVFTSYILYNKISNNVIAVECDPIAVRDLKDNFDINPHVSIIDKALYSEHGKVDFYHSSTNPVISSLLPPDVLKNHNAGVKGDILVSVDTVTIQDLIDKLGHIDLLKIDIEGGEYDIFDKLDTKLFDKINNLFIECHFFEENYLDRYNRLLKLLSNNGYLVEEYDKGQSANKGGSEVIFATKV